MCGVGLIWKYKYFGDLRHYRQRKFSQAMGFVILLYGLDCIVKYNKILLVNRFLFLNFHEASVLFYVYHFMTEALRSEDILRMNMGSKVNQMLPVRNVLRLVKQSNCCLRKGAKTLLCFYLYIKAKLASRWKTH